MRHRFIGGVEIAEHAGTRAEALLARQFQREAVDMRRDPADHRVAAPGHEQLVCGMAEKGVLGRIDQFELFAPQLRHRMRLARCEAAARIDEKGTAPLAFDRIDHHFTIHSRTPRSAWISPVCAS